MVQNANGYDSNSRMIENLDHYNRRPDWWAGQWNSWKERREEDGRYAYFRASSAPDDFSKEHTFQTAIAHIRSEILKEISKEIGAELRTSFARSVEESIRIEEGQGTEEMQEALSRQSSLDVSLLEDVEMQFDSFVQGLSQFEVYWERWLLIRNERTKREKRIEVNKVWAVFRISRADIEATRQLILDERAARLEGLAREASRENRERENFAIFSRQFESLRAFLNSSAPEVTQDMKMIRYLELAELLGRLDNLTTMRNDPSYIVLIREVREEMNKHDPSNYVRNLEIQLLATNARLDELRNEMERRHLAELSQARRGYSLQTQTTIISFPQRPREIEIPSANILASSDMVTNIDFISFSTINGINNLSRANQGLYASVTSITWEDAARYCNWLSRLYSLEPCYDEVGGRITGYNNRRNGFRLPEEHEINAILQDESGIIRLNEFSEIGIWSSTGFPQSFMAFKLSGRTQLSTLDRLTFQSINRVPSDWEIGFRVVRNVR
jgi:hypothetical protein